MIEHTPHPTRQAAPVVHCVMCAAIIIFHVVTVGGSKSTVELQPQRQTLASRGTALSRGGRDGAGRQQGRRGAPYVRGSSAVHGSSVPAVPSGRESHADLLAAAGLNTGAARLEGGAGRGTGRGGGRVSRDEVESRFGGEGGVGGRHGAMLKSPVETPTDGSRTTVNSPLVPRVSPPRLFHPEGSVANFQSPRTTDMGWEVGVAAGVAAAAAGVFDPRREQCGCNAATLDRNLLVVLSKPWRYFSSAHWFHICEYYLPHQSREVPLLSHTKTNATVYIQAPSVAFMEQLTKMSLFLLTLAFTNGGPARVEVVPPSAVEIDPLTNTAYITPTAGTFIYDASRPVESRFYRSTVDEAAVAAAAAAAATAAAVRR
eukprot:CAMPEP_0119481604 /NCGR_PEP_ID=MMETSP1344-20130328/9860_1 /TAXON_ID=236787 /ORGANISM="Florenciella parvula, Strain CCMP2471" /LENGTH=371 /DNA_ID=CAMNT_0007515981 /DNA_START=1071 /DNA_END=2184 /DNA_ORIENTATION=-